MRYQRVEWKHGSPGFPVVLYSEIDEVGQETRKIDEYADGHQDVAGAGIETGKTLLGEGPVPGLEDIDRDPQFSGRAIDEAEFEAVWRNALSWFDL